MEKIFQRFSDYDLFGYLAVGLIAFWLCDMVFETQLVLKNSWSFSSAAAVIIGGYIAGHIVSGVAAGLIDRAFVRKALGLPSNILMRPTKGKQPLWKRALVGPFLEPLHPALRKRVLERAGMSANEAARDGAGETIFWRAWPTLKREPIPYGRADSFLKLYGFCRSLSLLSFVAAIAFAIKAATGARPLQIGEYSWWAALAAGVSFVMFRRYLFFFRLYGQEVFSTFAESRNDD